MSMLWKDGVYISMKISDIPANEWNELREDYQDELACMTYIDDDEYAIMLHNSTKDKEKSMDIELDDKLVRGGIDLHYDDYNFQNANKNFDSWIKGVLKESEPFSMKEFYQTQYEQHLELLKSTYDFETKGWDENMKSITFKCQVGPDDTHTVTLEDHRWDEDIKDWLIFSEVEWNPYETPEPYALTHGEMQLFDRIIRTLSFLHPLENSTAP